MEAAISSIASRARPPRPDGVHEPVDEVRLAAQRGGHAGLLQALGVGLPLVAEGVETAGEDERRGEAADVGGQER